MLLFFFSFSVVVVVVVVVVVDVVVVVVVVIVVFLVLVVSFVVHNFDLLHFLPDFRVSLARIQASDRLFRLWNLSKIEK